MRISEWKGISQAEFAKFQSDYHATFQEQGFTRFEVDLKHDWLALLQPFPHPNTPKFGIVQLIEVSSVEQKNEVEVIEVDQHIVACDGTAFWVGHPRVFLRANEDGVGCPYCNRLFVLKAAEPTSHKS